MGTLVSDNLPDLLALSLGEAARRVQAKELSPVELTEACLRQIERRNPEINAFITVTADSALAEARAAEAEIQRGHWRGPLHGIPIALKDLIDTAGVRTTAASNLFKDRIPADDAFVVTRLKAAGAVFLGKLNLHEFAFGASSVISAFGPVRNPRNPAYSAGGSSSGSAAAVASGFCYAAVGTDTGGSIRQPASFCGIVGFKPTCGLVSAQGIVPLSQSLDHVGPMTRTVEDAALFLQAMTSEGVPDYATALHGEIGSLRIGIPQFYFHDSLNAEVEASVLSAQAILEGIVKGKPFSFDSPAFDFAAINTLGNVLTKAEAFAYHREYLAATPSLYQPETLRRIRTGAEVGAEEYRQALARLSELRASVRRIFDGVDILVTPTVAVPPSTIAELLGDPDKLRGREQISLRNTRPFNVLGLPSISIPCGHTRSGLPIGLQLTGAPGADAAVLQLAALYERAAKLA